MNRLFIVGAGGFGREVLAYALDIPRDRRDWDLAGFLDSRTEVLQGKNCSFPILGSPETYPFAEVDRVVCAVGEPRSRLHYCRLLKARGARFISLIHPTARVATAPANSLGEGCIFCPFSYLTNNVSVGNYVMFNVHAGAGHDAVIGDGCTLSGHVDVTGGVVLGEGVFVGSHASILPRVRVGDYAVVGAGSVVMKTVKPGATVFGLPATEI